MGRLLQNRHTFVQQAQIIGVVTVSVELLRSHNSLQSAHYILLLLPPLYVCWLAWYRAAVKVLLIAFIVCSYVSASCIYIGTLLYYTTIY